MSMVKAFCADIHNGWTDAPSWWERVKTVAYALVVIGVAMIAIEGLWGNVVDNRMGNGSVGADIGREDVVDPYELPDVEDF